MKIRWELEHLQLLNYIENCIVPKENLIGKEGKRIWYSNEDS